MCVTMYSKEKKRDHLGSLSAIKQLREIQDGFWASTPRNKWLIKEGTEVLFQEVFILETGTIWDSVELCLLGEGAGVRQGLECFSWPYWMDRDTSLRKSNQIFPFKSLFEPTPINWLTVFWNLFVIVNPYSHIRHKKRPVFGESAGFLHLFCLPTLHPPSCLTRLRLCQESLLPFSPCRAGSPDGSSVTQASLLGPSGDMEFPNFLWC